MTTTGCEHSAAQTALDAVTAFGRADAEVATLKQRAKQGDQPDDAEAIAAIDHYVTAFAGLRTLARKLVDHVG